MLSLSLCYHARLEDRKKYEEGVVEHFKGCIALHGGAQQFRDEIRWYDVNVNILIIIIIIICMYVGVRKYY